MGIKYKPTVKDNKLGSRFQRIGIGEGDPPLDPGRRTPKRLTKKEAARLAAKAAPKDPASQ